MRALASGDQRRRRPTPVITSMRCKPSGAPSSRSVVGWSVLPCRCLLMRTHYGPCRSRPGRWEGITAYGTFAPWKVDPEGEVNSLYMMRCVGSALAQSKPAFRRRMSLEIIKRCEQLRFAGPLPPRQGLGLAPLHSLHYEPRAPLCLARSFYLAST